MHRFPLSLHGARAAAAVAALAISVAAHSTPSGPCNGCFGVVTVGKSGLAGNCSTNTIQDAIDKAKLPEWADEIWITNDVLGGEYRVGTIDISDQIVEIVGGFDDCNDTTPDAFTTISGAGGQTNSVFTIRGSAVVGMTGLVITGGDDDIDSDGGGIDFKGSGRLTLAKMRILGNAAGFGGGIYANQGGSGALTIDVLDDVLIADNIAFRDGGGINVRGTTLNVVGNVVGVHRNQAAGYGGGIYSKIPGSVEISATGFPGDGGEFPVFFANKARQGGAIAAMGADDFNGSAIVRISPGVGGGPFVFYGNVATSEGGALFSGAVSTGFPDNTKSSGLFCAFDTTFRENVAPEGAAIYYDSASSVTDGGEQGYLSLNGGPGCGGRPIRRCAAGSACNVFVGNRTESRPGGPRTSGAVVEFEGSTGRFESRGSIFGNNIAGSLVHMGDGSEGSLLSLLNCALLMNDLTRPAVDSDADETVIRHCTIADNRMPGQFVLRIVESAATGFDRLASITNTIIAQPLNNSLDLSGAVSQTVINNVLATEISSLKPESAGGTVFIGNPAFTSPSAGDYRPIPTSIAVDYAPATLPDGSDDGFLFDALRLPRSVDLPPVPSGARLRDLGAFELQPTPGGPVDPLFQDGFE